MKARVKATGEIVEISEDSSYVNAQHFEKVYYLDELEWIDVKKNTDPDYWTRLEHKYAGMFLQAQISYGEQESLNTEEMVEDAMIYAHTLVQKLKKKEERK